ncbi:hypothetical protein A4X09_0g6539, partial [Tilletia walkeri]
MDAGLQIFPSSVFVAASSTAPGSTALALETDVSSTLSSQAVAESGKAKQTVSAVASTPALRLSSSPAPLEITAESVARMATVQSSMASSLPPLPMLPHPLASPPKPSELSHIRSEFNKHTSPLIWERFRLALQERSDAFNQAYGHIPSVVRDGFKMRSLAPAYETYVAKNYFKDEELPMMKKWVSKAMDDGFLAGLFTREDVGREIGHFHTIPLKLIVTEETETKPRKERVVADVSHPRSIPGRPLPPYKSINDQQDAADAPWEWFLVVNDIMIHG